MEKQDGVDTGLGMSMDLLVGLSDVYDAGLFEAFMENSPAQAWIADEQLNLYYMNRAYRRTFNLGDEVLFTKPSIFPQEYVEMYIRNNQKVLAEKTSLHTIEDGFDQNGLYKVFKVCKFPLGNRKGKPLVGGWMVELTGELKAEKELQASNERYHYASMATSEVIWEWDLVQMKMYMGEGYEALLGYPASLQLPTLESHVHPEDLPKVRSGVEKAIQEKRQRWQLEYRYLGRNGETKYVFNKAFIVYGANGTALRIIGALQDMTEMRKLQQKLISEQKDKRRKLVRAVMQAQENERNEVGRELHDNVNQLLVAAKLMIQTASKSPEKRETLLEQVGNLIDAALHENRTMSHRLVAPSMDACEFSDAVHAIASMLNLTERIKVEINLPSVQELAAISKDMRLGIYRIIQEQVGNILKHSSASTVTIRLTREAKSCKLTIEDDGIGFDIHGKRKGLGLKNIYSRVEVLKGNFKIISAPGKGCRLVISFPVSCS